MSKTPGTYALLAAVGNYNQESEFPNLDSSQHDLDIMTQALTRGLKIDTDNVRRLGEDGTVTAMSFARSIAEFNTMLAEIDTFIFYFSGHGQNGELVFSDNGITIRSTSQLLYSDVYASKQSEMRFHGRPADVIWCYFGHDEIDLIRSNHFAYTIWSGDEKLKWKSIRPDILSERE